ncbi:MAG: imidazoleglycerol-phosphate dehydratase HisB [Lachnospiraceae bacterium]|nr:imidazoleglycerol-phosphate dehydratase HisB [Lachnospiraceae bacterium]MBQ1514605.1 imidazoleglycerol-phosphate dehydratase HisB [Lachnospiraceae bacterium]MBQ4309630.1 imidazoleglycerol-phosphate dehydratase HisB [Lachnospiraceae bacterium]MBR2737704.1 imidazoleglycerol-phosphate dehydratase HisB [Lachnospiraceae bacterium]
MSRIGSVKRITKETDVEIRIDLDGTGEAEISTGIGFFDHMLNSFARHGLFDLTVRVTGDLEVDAHHTIEDTGIALGTAIAEALGDKLGIRRYGSCILPHDETLILTALDLSGRPFFVFDAQFDTPMVGEFPTEMVYDFFYAVCYASMMNLHIREMSGSNAHHIIEAMFKSFAKSLDAATMIDERVKDRLPSTKGAL